MDTLKLEVVRFNCEDVIATSPTIIGGKRYAALRSEADEAGNISNLDITGAAMDPGGTWILFQNGVCDFTTNYWYSRGFGAVPYAWYDSDNGWVTEGVVRDYGGKDDPVDQWPQ